MLVYSAVARLWQPPGIIIIIIIIIKFIYRRQLKIKGAAAFNEV